MADSYTITFKEGNGTDSDSGTKVTSVADIIASGDSYVSAVATATNVYNARVGRGIKLGTSKAAGELTLTLAESVNATSIVVSARKYNDSEKGFSIQGQDFTADDGDDFVEFTYTYESATAITSISLASPKRIYFTSVTVNYGEGGGEQPVEPEMAYYVNGTMTQWAVSEDYKLVANTEAVGEEYMGVFTFAANDEFKVVYSDGETAESTNYFPLGIDNNYVVSAAGEYTVYFRPAGDMTGVEGWHYGCIYMEEYVEPEVPVYTCAQVQANEASVEGFLNEVTVMWIKNKNIFVRDLSGMTQVYFENSGLQVGDIVSGIKGTSTMYQTTPEFVPSNAPADWTIVNGEAPVYDEKEVAATTSDVNGVYKFMNVTFAEAVEFTTEAATNVTVTIGEGTNTLRNNYKLAYTFEAEKAYNIVALVSIYQNNPQLYFISAEEVIVPEVMEPVVFGVKVPAIEGGVQVFGTFAAEAVALELNPETGWYINYHMEAKASDSFVLRDATNAENLLCQFYPADNEEGGVWVRVAFTFGDVWVADTYKGNPVKWIEIDMSNANLYAWKTEYDTVAPEIPTELIELDFSEGLVLVSNEDYEDYGSTDLVFTTIPVDAEGYFVGDGDFLQIEIYPEDPNNITGKFTMEEETMDDYYTYLMRVEGTDTTEIDFVMGEIEIEMLQTSVEYGVAQLKIDATLLGNDDNVYEVVGTFVAYYDFIEDEPVEAVENTEAAAKVIKRIEMGNVVIYKNGEKYSVMGAKL